MKGYANRFREFLGMLPGTESLDDPAVLDPSEKIKRADYLLFQRSMIVEVKQLETDPAWRVEAVVERYRFHPSYPLFFGQRTLDAVLEHMPADIQEEIRQHVYDSITKSIMSGCEEGNRQIRETRAHFGLLQSSGVVFILNDSVPILSPNVLAARLRQQMRKRFSDGADRFPEIAHACAITWAHLVLANDQTPSHPLIIAEGPAARAHPTASQQLDYILDAWTRYENANLIQNARANLENYRSALPSESPSQIRQHERWRTEYRAQRYLAAMSVPELMAHGQDMFAELAPHFLIGGARKCDPQELRQRWTDFLEECQLRNLDMRRFSPVLPPTSDDGSTSI